MARLHHQTEFTTVWLTNTYRTAKYRSPKWTCLWIWNI